MLRAAAFASVLCALGCVSPLQELRSDNRRLSGENSELRDEKHVQERQIRDLQHQLDQARAANVAESVPQLPVETIAPKTVVAPAPADGPRVVGVTEDGTEIVYDGDAAAGKSVTLDEDTLAALTKSSQASQRHSPSPASVLPADASVAPVPAGDKLEVTHKIPPLSARAAPRTRSHPLDAPPDRGGDAGTEYRAAVELVKGGSYAEALTALHAFLAKYPKHDYADNAQYWIGETFYAQHDYARALVEFRTVVEVYPRGNKVPDALLKIGFCHQQLGQADKARAVLGEVVSRFPKSEPAALAEKRLAEGAPQ
ncbi:MAG TPA: tol-pal system protein YbgF [Kofleriaceae bacterium]|jgi:tol-pal system protein YbgF